MIKKSHCIKIWKVLLVGNEWKFWSCRNLSCIKRYLNKCGHRGRSSSLHPWFSDISCSVASRLSVQRRPGRSAASRTCRTDGWRWEKVSGWVKKQKKRGLTYLSRTVTLWFYTFICSFSFWWLIPSQALLESVKKVVVSELKVHKSIVFLCFCKNCNLNWINVTRF